MKIINCPITLQHLRNTYHSSTKKIMIEEIKNKHYHSIFDFQQSSLDSLQP